MTKFTEFKMHLYEDQFSEKYDFSETMPEKVLVIASTGRSGSHMLGHALYKTGCFGFPLEYANPINIAEWKRKLKEDNFHGVMEKIKRRRTSPNGVFGIKIHYPHIKQFGGFEGLVKEFPNAYYVLLSRKNVLRQAVSLSIARQSGVWISGQEAVGREPIYDFDHINRCLRETIINNASWRYLLAAGGCNYIEMDFDHVRCDLANAVKDIAHFMGVEVELSRIPHEQATKDQSGNINDEWVRKFYSEFDKSLEVLDKEKMVFLRRFKRKVMRVMGF